VRLEETETFKRLQDGVTAAAMALEGQAWPLAVNNVFETVFLRADEMRWMAQDGRVPLLYILQRWACVAWARMCCAPRCSALPLCTTPAPALQD
jgi:hypothetical protein